MRTEMVFLGPPVCLQASYRSSILSRNTLALLVVDARREVCPSHISDEAPPILGFCSLMRRCHLIGKAGSIVRQFILTKIRHLISKENHIHVRVCVCVCVCVCGVTCHFSCCESTSDICVPGLTFAFGGGNWQYKKKSCDTLESCNEEELAFDLAL